MLTAAKNLYNLSEFSAWFRSVHVKSNLRFWFGKIIKTKLIFRKNTLKDKFSPFFVILLARSHDMHGWYFSIFDFIFPLLDLIYTIGVKTSPLHLKKKVWLNRYIVYPSIGSQAILLDILALFIFKNSMNFYLPNIYNIHDNSIIRP